MWKTFAVFVLLVHTVSSQAEYDCRRLDDCSKDDGAVCEVTDEGVGKCTCATGFTGRTCEIVDGTTCTDPECVNGQCYVKNGANKCACKDGFIGPKCEKEIMKISCTGYGMTVDFNFPTGFKGEVLAVKESDNTSLALPATCKFSADPDDASVTTMSVKVSEASGNDTGCLNDQFSTSKDEEKDETTYTSKFRVRYVANLYTELDLEYFAYCRLKKDDIVVYQEASNIKVDTFTTVNKNGSLKIINFQGKTKDGGDITEEPVKIGDELTFLFHLTDTKVYKSLRIESCFANNTLADTASREVTWFNKGCLTVMGQKVAYEQEESTDTDGNPGKSIKMKAFKFVDSNKVGVVCKVKVCEEGEEQDCLPPTNCTAIRLSEEEDTETGGPENGEADAGGAENGETDAGGSENGETDAGGAENGETDSGGAENGETDNGGAENGKTDGGGAANGETDAGGAENGETDTGGAENGETDAGGAENGKTDDGGAANGETDAGGAENGETDAGGAENGETDAGGAENGETDNGGAENEKTDGGGAANGETDAGGAENGETDTGGAENGETDAGEAANGKTDDGGAANGETDAGGAENGETDGGGPENVGENAGESDANGAEANNEKTPVSRKRRAASQDKKELVSTVLNIGGPGASPSEAAQTKPPSDTVQECLSQAEILAAIIVLGSTVCILFIACFILSCLMLRRKSWKDSVDSRATKLSDRFHIPRAHVNDSFSNL